MIAPTDTTFRRLSSLWLIFSFSPIEDPDKVLLQARAAHFSSLVTWSTIVVAIGVVLEGVEICHDVIAWRKRKSRLKRGRIDLEEAAAMFPTGELRGDTESHSEHPKWVKRILRLGLILVVIGVVGEWRYGAKLEDSHNAIHEYDIGKLTAADKKAGDAAKSANAAHEEADAAKAVSATALDKSNAANTAAGETQGKVGIVSKRADDLLTKYVDAEQNIEAEKNKRLKLAASLLDRNFRDQSGAIGVLSSIAPVSVIFRFPQEREIRKTAEQINFVVGQLNWQSSVQPPDWYVKPGITITPGRIQFSGGGSNEGRVNEWRRLQETCEAVARALQHSGLDATASGPIPENLPPNTILIIVGEKPNHVLEDAIKELGEAAPTPTGRLHATSGGSRVAFSESDVAPCTTPCKTP